MATTRRWIPGCQQLPSQSENNPAPRCPSAQPFEGMWGTGLPLCGTTEQRSQEASDLARSTQVCQRPCQVPSRGVRGHGAKRTLECAASSSGDHRWTIASQPIGTGSTMGPTTLNNMGLHLLLCEPGNPVTVSRRINAIRASFAADPPENVEQQLKVRPSVHVQD